MALRTQLTRVFSAARHYSSLPAPENSLTKISDFTKAEIQAVLDTAADLKSRPEAYSDVMARKTLIMLFQKPSLRTRVSFEVGMNQMGGSAINYPIDAGAPLGKKETIGDTGKVLSRYCDAIMARLNDRKEIWELAESASVPMINGLDDFAHPCQMLADMQTITEVKGGVSGIKMAFLGDIANNVTYDLMRAACVMGFDINVCGPSGEGFDIEEGVIQECDQLAAAPGAGSYKIVSDPREAVAGVDVVYCDSWMSYGISSDELEQRKQIFMPYQVNDELMSLTHSDSFFMNCLPAARGMEQTASVIDGPKSVVFDQAENRLHAQKALLVKMVAGWN